MSEDDDKWEEEQTAERYPWLYGVAETPYEPPGHQLSPHHQKILDLERAKLAARREVAEEHGEDYHNLDELTDEKLPTLNFRRYDNLFLARPAMAFLKQAKGKPKRERRLFSNFWLEGELCVLFAETGCGKSVLAMQIARALAGGKRFEPFEVDVEPARVAYFDFEMNDEQFTKRYSSNDEPSQEDDDLFPDGLIRCPPQMLRELPPGFEDNYDFLISSIVNLVEYLGVRFVIIDNLTWLSPNLESSRAAQRLMQTLANLKNGLGVSILVLAHTPKRFSRSPILIAHLHGSKMLSNFAESMFAMGTSRRGNRIRYIKAIKYRYSPDRDTETEVATVRIGKEGSFLGFTFENFTDERSHVGWRHRETSAARPEFVRKVEELVLRQFTQREIADELGVSQTTINRCLKGKNEEGSPVSL